MEWGKLLSQKRLGREDDPAPDVRTDYQRDYDRIVYSSAFRRMQDKTQVFPLAESDYVRTRLTHSIEVSCVGRSLGTLVGERVNNKESFTAVLPQDFGNIVAAACLAHDIGNPPFGHSGEEAISAWFRGSGSTFLEGLSDSERNDFCYFEGNAQGLRLLTKLQNAVGEGGLQLTYATLAAFAKYPLGSSHMPPVENPPVSEKKFGYFQSDVDIFRRIAEGTELTRKRDGVWCRHPLAFLVEAADDICYRVIDLEDGHRLGRVSYDETQRLLTPIAFPDGSPTSSFDRIVGEKERVEYLRAVAISKLIYAAVTVFDEQYDKILGGTFESDLMSHTPFARHLAQIKIVSRQRVYSTPSVLHIEAAGFGILGGLLERVVPALIEDQPATSAAKKMRELIPPQFIGRADKYERLMAATDYISGMTDSHALTLYRRLAGIELPRS